MKMSLGTKIGIILWGLVICLFAFNGFMAQTPATVPANQSVGNVPSATLPTPPKTESKPLSAVGAIAAESIRTKWQEINAEYGALQEDEREKGKLGPDWTLDVLGNRMIRQVAAAPATAAPAPQVPAPTAEPDKKFKKK